MRGFGGGGRARHLLGGGLGDRWRGFGRRRVGAGGLGPGRRGRGGTSAGVVGCLAGSRALRLELRRTLVGMEAVEILVWVDLGTVRCLRGESRGRRRRRPGLREWRCVRRP